MPLFLTEPQQQALDATDGATRLVHPVTGVEYVLVPAGDYERVWEGSEDEQFQRAVRQVALRNAAARLDEEPLP